MNYCYTTLLTSDNYLQGVILLKECLRRVRSKYDFICLINDNLSKDTLEKLNKAHIKLRKVDNIASPKQIYEHNKKLHPGHADLWRDTFTKFRIWQMTEYDKVIFLDADLLILKNLDHCFDMDLGTDQVIAAHDGEYYNIWPKDFHFNSGFMVVKPSEETFSNLLGYINNLDPETFINYAGQNIVIADQDILNKYFDSWKGHKSLQLSKYYNVFAPYFWQADEADLEANAYFIHFVGIKPWTFANNKPQTLLTDIPGKKSFWPFELAFSIITMAYENEFADIDWSNEDKLNATVAQMALEFYNDKRIAYDYAKRLPQGNEVRNYVINAVQHDEIKEVVMKVIELSFLSGKACPAYTYEIISAIQQGNDKLLYYWWDKIAQPVIDEYADV